MYVYMYINTLMEGELPLVGKPCVLDALTSSSLSTAVGKSSREGSVDMVDKEASNSLEYMFWM